MSVITDQVPVRPAYTTQWLFHKEEFLRLTSNKPLRTFYQYSPNEVTAMLRCSIQDSSADASPGGFYGFAEIQPSANMPAFLNYIQEELSRSGISRIALTLFPEQYDPENWKRQRDALLEAGFRVEGSMNHRMIPVTMEENEQLSSNDWRMGARTLHEFSITQEPLDQYDKIAQLIHRSETNVARNGDDAYVEKFLANFPEETLLFAIREGVKYCGMAVLLQVGPGILYTVHIAQLEAYEEKKPMLDLFQFVYEWAEYRDYRFIDLGQIAFGYDDNVGMVQCTGERWVRTW